MIWKDRRLDELGFIARGRSRHRPRDAVHLYGGPYPFIQTGDVKHADLYIRNYSQTYSEAGLAQSKLWPAGTLCITIAANIAETSILGFDACFPDSIIGFNAFEDKADTRFIKYLFDAHLKRRYQMFTQGATQDNLSQEKLLSIALPIPDLIEQKRIAEILSAYDDLIENNRRRIELLDQSGRLLYKEWFVNLRFPGHERVKVVNGVPEGWALGRVVDLGDVITGKTPSTKDERNFGGNIPFVKTPDMHNQIVIVTTNETLSESGANQQPTKFIPPGSVMVSCIGTVGVVAVSGETCQTNQQINSVVTHDPDARYYAYYALSDLKPRLEAMSGGATMSNVNKGKFESLRVMLPAGKVLALFNEAVSPVFQQIQTLAVQNLKLTHARDILLPRLMNGEISV